MITRRRFVFTSAALCAQTLIAQVEEGAPLVVELPFANFDLTAPMFAAVNTSGYTSCQVQLADAEGRTVLQSQDWGTEPNVSNAGPLEPAQPGAGKQRLKPRIVMRPTRKKTPSVGMALTQGAGTNLTQLKQQAKGVRFVDDPAKPPQGRFELVLATDASVSVAIWPGETPQGRPIYTTRVSGLPAGSNPIVWSLHDNTGIQVRTGRYTALLTSTPTSKTGLHPTVFCSYFAVTTA